METTFLGRARGRLEQFGLATMLTFLDLERRSAPADVVEIGCSELPKDGRVYLKPPANRPDFTGRLTACVHVAALDASGPSADGGLSTDGRTDASSPIQFVVSGRATDKCKGLTHYTLRGCDQSVSCLVPDWDLTRRTHRHAGRVPRWLV